MLAGLVLPVLALPTAAHADALQGQLLAAAKAVSRDAYAFRHTIAIERSGAPRKVIVESFDPRRAAADRWTLVSIDGRAPTAKEIAQARKVKRQPTASYADLADWIGAPATRIATTPGSVTYRFARLPAGVLKIGSHDASADTAAEAVVNTAGPTPFVERVRFTSATSFRMALVVSIQTIAISARYQMLPNGQPAPADTASVMTGSLLGKAGQLRATVTYSDIQAVR